MVINKEVDDMAIAMEVRRAVAADHEDCGSSAEVAQRFGVSESWVRRLVQRQRETGSLEPRPIKLPDNTKLKQKDLEQLTKLITQKPDMTLEELAAALTTKVSIATVHRATKKLDYSFKKSRSTHRNRTGQT
jgi:transposase